VFTEEFMSIILIIFALGSIVGAILLIRKSAKKFNLTAEQLEKIKARNQLIDKEEQEEDK
jgi:hypothetical protein